MLLDKETDRDREDFSGGLTTRGGMYRVPRESDLFALRHMDVDETMYVSRSRRWSQKIGQVAKVYSSD